MFMGKEFMGANVPHPSGIEIRFGESLISHGAAEYHPTAHGLVYL